MVRRRYSQVRIALFVMVGIVLLALVVSANFRNAIGMAWTVLALEMGLSKPNLAIVPIVLITVWIILDIVAVVIGLRVMDRRKARQDALRRRLLEEEGLIRPEDVSAPDKRRFPG